MSIEEYVSDWVTARAAEPMVELWDPLLVELWTYSIEQLHETLSSVTLRDLCIFGLTDDTIAGDVKNAIAPTPETRHSLDRAVSRFAERALQNDTLETLKKLASNCKDRGIEPLETFIRERGNPSGLSVLMKYPTKQNPYECAVSTYLRQNLKVEDGFPLVVQLSRSPVTLRFTAEGAVSTEPRRKGDNSRSVDILVVKEDAGVLTILLGTHKVARVSGGFQNSQLIEVEKFVQLASQCTAAGAALIEESVTRLGVAAEGREVRIEPLALLDGDYFFGRPLQVPGLIQGNTDEVLTLLRAFVPRTWPHVEPLPPEAIDALT